MTAAAHRQRQRHSQDHRQNDVVARVISNIIVTAVIAAPVAPPTIAPMPTIAKAGRLIWQVGQQHRDDGGEGSPIVAPMNSDGENTPPDEPEPRLIDVASNLQTNNSTKNHPTGIVPGAAIWLSSAAWIVE